MRRRGQIEGPLLNCRYPNNTLECAPVALGGGAVRRRRCGFGSKRRQRGVFSVEFALTLFVAVALFAFIGEFLRISMIDQALARATSVAARAVAATPAANACRAAASDAIRRDAASNWALDSDNDGTIATHIEAATGWPDPSNAGEVLMVITWDDDPAGGVDWSDAAGTGCGGTDSWLRLRTRIAVQPWFGPFRAATPNGIVLRHESWAKNDRP